MNRNIIFVIMVTLTTITIMTTVHIVYADDDDCSESIAIVKAEHFRATVKDNSWYGAGLMLALHYVEKDCAMAKDRMSELLDDLWIAQSEYKIDKRIIDQISTGVRFVNRTL